MTIVFRLLAITLTGLALVLLTLIFTSPMRFLFKFLLNGVLGLCWLVLFNFIGSFIGIGIGVNVMSSLVAGVLGFPGVALLLLLRLILVT